MLVLLSSCSLFGLQSEETPKYEVLVKEGDFEIRKYSSCIIAQTTVLGNYDDSSTEAFKILAGYIFGKNKTKLKISMTSPVEMKQESLKIGMTTPVQMKQEGSKFTMMFSMPAEYRLEDLPEPLDKRIIFKQIEPRIIASHQFSGLRSLKKNDKKVSELREWLINHNQYRTSPEYSYAGYNPPWTIPFLRRNEVHINLELK